MKHKSRPIRITQEPNHHNTRSHQTVNLKTHVFLGSHGRMSTGGHEEARRPGKERSLSNAKLFYCEVCHRDFTTNGNLMAHMRVHNGQRPFKCLQCDKRFTTKGNMQTHLRIHTGDKPFVCVYCGKRFAAFGNCQVHMRTHTKEKPFKCEYCQKCFSVKGNLMVHYKRHTGEKSFACEFCNKMFLTNYNLRVHMKSHVLDIKTVKGSFTKSTNTKIYKSRKSHASVSEQGEAIGVDSQTKATDKLTKTSLQNSTRIGSEGCDQVTSGGSCLGMYEKGTFIQNLNMQSKNDQNDRSGSPIDFSSMIEDVWQKIKDTDTEQNMETISIFTDRALSTPKRQTFCSSSHGDIVASGIPNTSTCLPFADELGVQPKKVIQPRSSTLKFQPLLLEHTEEGLNVNM